MTDYALFMWGMTAGLVLGQVMAWAGRKLGGG